MKSENIYTVIEAENWDDAKLRLQKLSPGWAFRGQHNHGWELSTSIERLRKRIPANEAEHFLITEFSRRVHLYLDRSKFTPDDTLEKLALMQHHGAPTRLSDWTYSAYIAGFFAFEQPNSENDKVSIWAVDIEWLRTETNSRIAETADSPTSQYHDLFYENRNIWNRQDFSSIILSNRLNLVAPLEPYYTNERMTIQQGLFLVPGNIKESFMENLKSYVEQGIQDHLLKIIISNEARIDALADLYDMNINRTSLFPGIDGFAQSFNTRFEIERWTNW